jgi:hypothetical protein
MRRSNLSRDFLQTTFCDIVIAIDLLLINILLSGVSDNSAMPENRRTYREVAGTGL